MLATYPRQIGEVGISGFVSSLAQSRQYTSNPNNAPVSITFPNRRKKFRKRLGRPLYVRAETERPISQEHFSQDFGFTTFRMPLIQASIKQVPSSLSKMLSSLSDLLRESVDYDEEYLKPSSFAFERMYELIEQSSIFLKLYPIGDVYATGDGGIRCDWRVGGRQMRLVISPESSGRHYVYLQEGDKFGGNDAFSVKQLGDYLNWLTNDNISSPQLQLRSLSDTKQ